VRGGRPAFETARGELRVRAGDICLVPPHEPWRATTNGVDLAPSVLDPARVAAVAAARCGTEPDSLVFTGLEPVSPALAQHRWWSGSIHRKSIDSD
jgi:hypothetical protein